MTNALFTEDFEYLYSKLIKHPLFIINAAEQARFNALFSTVTGNTAAYNDFLSGINRLTCFFSDGHTNMELPYSPEDPTINLACYWLESRLLLSNAYKNIECNSEIVAIENTPVQDLIHYMSERIPHENEYLVKSRMINYPYQNYHLFSRYKLGQLYFKIIGTTGRLPKPILLSKEKPSFNSS